MLEVFTLYLKIASVVRIFLGNCCFYKMERERLGVPPVQDHLRTRLVDDGLNSNLTTKEGLKSLVLAIKPLTASSQ